MSATLKRREEYQALRRCFEPEDIKLVIVTEAPPSSGLYFYDPTGLTTEPLCAAIMRELGRSPKTKDDGLREMQRRGWILVDATYEAVHGLRRAARDAVIARDYPLLRDDLKELLGGRPVPVILVKANVCRVLNLKLVRDGFNVLNRGLQIYFPSSGREIDFHRRFIKVKRRGRLQNGPRRSLITSPAPPQGDG
jgi:hypothetical protein